MSNNQVTKKTNVNKKKLSKLEKYMEKKKNSNITERLPLMHSCEAYFAEQIIFNNSLNPVHCPVFEKDLLYFFVGKPSYPVGDKIDKNQTNDMYYPVCFISDSQISKIKMFKAFPFDTGGCTKYVEEGLMHKSLLKERKINVEKLNELYSLSDEETLYKFISIFYDNINNYMNDEPVLESTEITDIDNLINLFNRNIPCEVDNRSQTVEVIYDKKINVKKYVKAVIVPDVLLRKKSDDGTKTIESVLKNEKIEIIKYKYFPFKKPIMFHGLILEKAYDYLKENKYM